MATSSFHYLQLNPLVTSCLFIFRKLKFAKAKSIIYSQMSGVLAAFLISVIQTGTYKIHRINAREIELFFISEIDPNPEGKQMSFNARMVLMAVMCFMFMFTQFICFSKCKENKVRFSMGLALFYLCTIGTFKLRVLACFNQIIFLPYALVSGYIGFDYIILYFIIPILFTLLGAYYVNYRFKNLMEHGNDKSMNMNYDMLEPKKIQLEV